METPPDRKYALFTAAWSAALLAHVCSSTIRSWNPWEFLLAAASLAGVFRPAWPGILPALAVLQLGSLAARMPHTANHWLLAGIVNLGLLGAMAASRETGPSRRTRALEAAGPVVRALVVLLYLAAGFHKLNAGFFDAGEGCVAYGLRRAAERAGADPGGLVFWAVPASSAAVMLIELAIPVLLLRPRTRLWGLALGWLFHTLTLETNFASIIFALYLFFAPHGPVPRPKNWALEPGTALKAYALFSLAWIPFIHDFRHFDLVAVIRLKGALWFLISAAAGIPVLRHLHLNKAAFAAPGPSARPPNWLWAFPALAVLNALCPYLGLKTTTSFSMFSNLRTEGRRSNHFLLGSNPLKIFGFQEDLVEIVASEPEGIARLTRDGPMNFLTFKRRVQGIAADYPGRKVRIVYTRGGKTLTAEDARRDPVLGAPEPLWSRKLLAFRPPYPKKGAPDCPW